MKSLAFLCNVVIFISICFSSTLSVNSSEGEKETDKGKDVPSNQPSQPPHRPNRGKAMEALLRAQFHVDSAKHSEDRIWRSDNQLHNLMDSTKYKIHQREFEKEKTAFNLAWYGTENEPVHHQQQQQLTHSPRTKTRLSEQEIRAKVKMAISNKRKELKIQEEEHSSTTPSKQLRIGSSNVEHHNPNIATKRKIVLSEVHTSVTQATQAKPPRAGKPRETSTRKRTTSTPKAQTPPAETQQSSRTTESPKNRKDSGKSSKSPRKPKDERQ